MTDFATTLETAIARTGVERYRYLCLEHPDPAVRAGYMRLVVAIAHSSRCPRCPFPETEPCQAEHDRSRCPEYAPPVLEPVAQAIAGTRAMKACPYRSRGPGCGCSGAKCGLRRGSIVSHSECLACIGSHG